MKRIQIINGPNLNLLGKREPSLYGNQPFEVYFDELKTKYPQIDLFYFQSNIEGEIVNKLHEVGFDFDGIIINAGAYTHTSIAIADAIRAIKRRQSKSIFPMYINEKPIGTLPIFLKSARDVFLDLD